MRQIGFVVEPQVPDSVRASTDPPTADLNTVTAAGKVQLRVEFRADSSYQFSVRRAGQLVRAEAGSYRLAPGRLTARSAAAGRLLLQPTSALAR